MIKRIRKRIKKKLHFLHVGKTGGSAIKSVLEKYKETSKYLLVLHGHGTSLRAVPEGESVVFFLRDPVSRFISGFYSRQRKGQPRFYSEWTSQEKEVFETFATPDELASSLASESSENHALAIKAMSDVQHLRHYDDWYVDFDYFKSRIDDILYVGFQESLEADFIRLREILKLPKIAALPDDDVGMHRNPERLDKSISESGVIALNKWYSEDIKFVLLCNEIMSTRQNNADNHWFSKFIRVFR
jgi:hypothetical protein